MQIPANAHCKDADPDTVVKKLVRAASGRGFADGEVAASV